MRSGGVKVTVSTVTATSPPPTGVRWAASTIPSPRSRICTFSGHGARPAFGVRRGGCGVDDLAGCGDVDDQRAQGAGSPTDVEVDAEATGDQADVAGGAGSGEQARSGEEAAHSHGFSATSST